MVDKCYSKYPLYLENFIEKETVVITISHGQAIETFNINVNI